MDVVPGGDWGAVEGGGLVVPAAEGGFDLFVDAVADGLHNFGLYYVALRVDGYFDDDIAHQIAWERGAIHGRVGKYGGIGDVDFVAGDGSIDHGAERRSGVGVVVARVGIGKESYRFRRGLGRWRLWEGMRLRRT